MTIRIESDGTPQNTHVFTEDGEKIRGVTKIDINVEYNKPVTATLTFDLVFLDLLAKEENGDEFKVKFDGCRPTNKQVENLIDELNETIDRNDKIFYKKQSAWVETIARWFSCEYYKTK